MNNLDDDGVLYVGVCGYVAQEFDEVEAREILEDALDDIEDEYLETEEFDEICIVSGLVNKGMPKIAYEVADNRGYNTMAVVPDEIDEIEEDLYPVDTIIYEGDKFGDESEKFIDVLDVFIKIGGGNQSEDELELAEKEDISVMDYDLEAL